MGRASWQLIPSPRTHVAQRGGVWSWSGEVWARVGSRRGRGTPFSQEPAACTSHASLPVPTRQGSFLRALPLLRIATVPGKLGRTVAPSEGPPTRETWWLFRDPGGSLGAWIGVGKKGTAFRFLGSPGRGPTVARGQAFSFARRAVQIVPTLVSCPQRPPRSSICLLSLWNSRGAVSLTPPRGRREPHIGRRWPEPPAKVGSCAK